MFSDASSSTRIGLNVFGSPCRQKRNSLSFWPHPQGATLKLKSKQSRNAGNCNVRLIAQVPPIQEKQIGNRSLLEPVPVAVRSSRGLPLLRKNLRIRAGDFPKKEVAPSRPGPAC